MGLRNEAHAAYVRERWVKALRWHAVDNGARLWVNRNFLLIEAAKRATKAHVDDAGKGGSAKWLEIDS
jgi:hypothetical protein